MSIMEQFIDNKQIEPTDKLKPSTLDVHSLDLSLNNTKGNYVIFSGFYFSYYCCYHSLQIF